MHLFLSLPRQGEYCADQLGQRSQHDEPQRTGHRSPTLASAAASTASLSGAAPPGPGPTAQAPLPGPYPPADLHTTVRARHRHKVEVARWSISGGGQPRARAPGVRPTARLTNYRRGVETYTRVWLGSMQVSRVAICSNPDTRSRTQLVIAIGRQLGLHIFIGGPSSARFFFSFASRGGRRPSSAQPPRAHPSTSPIHTDDDRSR